MSQPPRLTDAALQQISELLADPTSYDGGTSPQHPGTADELRALFETLAKLPLYIYSVSGDLAGPTYVRGLFGDPEPVLGRTREEVLGLDARALPHPDELEHHTAVATEAMANGDYYEVMGRAAPVDDEERWFFSLSGLEVHDGEIQLYGITLKSRQLAALQAELREKAERLEDLTENVPGTVYQWLLKPDGTMSVPYISDGVKQVIGAAPEQVYAEPDHISRFVLPEDAPGVMESIVRSAETLEPWHRVYRARHPNGEIKTLFGAGRPRKLPDGSVLWNSATFDITEVERRNAEERRRDHAAFEAQKLESLGRLASGVAHDVNNLLVGVLGNASVLVEGLSGEDAEVAREIETAAQRCAALTEQILAFAGRGRAKSEVVDLETLAREMARLTQVGRGSAVTLEIPALSEPAKVRGDPTQLGQVVLNLLTNAFESSGNEVAVWLRLGHEGDRVVLEVEDDGDGMSPETRERVFEPFFTTKPKGRGLGLAATAGIVRAHGGEIAVESQVGEGTRFRVLLPAVRGEPAAQARVAPIRTPSAGRVLVIDDEEHVLDVTSRLLARRGFEVVPVSGGAEGVEVFRDRGPFDFVILDLTMPEPSGAAVLEAIREQAPDQAVVLFSGYSEDEVDALVAGRPRITFLQKPFTGAALVAAMGRVGD